MNTAMLFQVSPNARFAGGFPTEMIGTNGIPGGHRRAETQRAVSDAAAGQRHGRVEELVADGAAQFAIHVTREFEPRREIPRIA